jgi:tetratricopeptide (TPR) repeat protein
METARKTAGARAGLIVLLTVLAYLPAMRGGFNWDDGALITDNPMVKASDGLYRFWFTAEAADYRPLTWSLWWLEWRLWDSKAMGYHVINVLLHAVNAVLVWKILQRLKIPGAWLAAMVFAIHPVNVATAAWISEQKNTLSMLFFALAILLYLRFDEEQGWPWYGLSLAAYLLALLSKTAVVMTPVVLLGCAWWRRGRVQTRDWLCTAPFFLPSLVMALVTIIQHKLRLGDTVVQTGGFAGRLAGAGWAPWFYLSKALLPVNLTVIYPKWEIDPARWISYVPGVLLLALFPVFWWERETWGRSWLFGLGYFVVMLFPVLGFFDQAFYRYSLVADHWQYYSILGVIALGVAGGEICCRRISERSKLIRVLASAAVLVVLATATWQRSCLYADAEILWRDNVAKNPNSWAAHNNCGLALQARAKFDDAIVQYEQALRINPDLADAHNNLGIVLQNMGRGQEAIEHWEQALRLVPDYAVAQNNLGNALFQVGAVQKGIDHYKQALRIDPDYAEAHCNLASALAQLGRMPEAIEHFEQALRIMPDDANTHYNLGIALEQVGRMKEAMEHYQQALRINPDHAAAQNKLTRLRTAQGAAVGVSQ